MKAKRMYHSIRLLLCRSASKRAIYLKKHHVFASIGNNCKWGPWLVPLYPELIKLHDNVSVHKTARLVPHDMVNSFLSRCVPGQEFAVKERLGCIEIMDNVYVAMGSYVLPNVKIGKNCIVSTCSVVNTDVPENTVVAGVPAKPVGRFDMYYAMRKMQSAKATAFKNQELPADIALAEWEQFDKRHKNIAGE